MEKSDLSELKNIGKSSAKMLNEIGVFTRNDISRYGPVKIFHILKINGYPVSMLMVYALQGAIMNLHWNSLPEKLKKELREEVENTSIEGLEIG